jgi:hypothetical protein
MSKFQVKWKSPRRVASAESDYVFVVEILPTKDLKAAHATRLKFCNDKELNVPADLIRLPSTTIISSKSCRRFSTRATMNKRCLMTLVAWCGLPVEKATWEPYSVMAVDVPEMAAEFMESHEDIDMVREMRSLGEFSLGIVMRC